MFLAVPARRKLLARLRKQLRPGGAIIVFDKLVPPGGYPATVLARLTWDSKLRQGAEPEAYGTHYADLTQSVSDRAGGNASHTHTILIGSASSSSLPPYYALAYIIKL